MAEVVWEEWEDEYGKYKERVNENGMTEKLVVSYKQKYWDENPIPEQEPLPLPLEDRVTDLEVTSIDTLSAVAEVYEETITREDETVAGMIATAEVFEYAMGLESLIEELRAEVEALKGSAK